MNQDIYVRAHTVQIGAKECKAKDHRKPLKWPAYVLVFDCETRLTPGQALTFGFWRFCQLQKGEYVCLEEGIYYDHAELSAIESKLLQKYAASHNPETAQEGCDRLRRYARPKFVPEVLGMAIQAKALIVGFNLPFDLSRLALDWTEADNGGWSLILSQWKNTKTGVLGPNKYFPRITVKALNSKTAIINSTLAPMHEPKKKGEKVKLWPAGRFLDVRTLLWALRNKSYSLNKACEKFEVDGKFDHKPTGTVTLEEIEYCRQDVRATVALLNAVKQEYDLHPITPGPDRLFSPASVAKAYLEELNISFPRQKVTNA
jgi:hypothetical protein